MFFPEPGRELVVGSGGTCEEAWGVVPLGCSIQSRGDGTAHYKIGGDKNEGCIADGYQLICRNSTKTNNDHGEETTSVEQTSNLFITSITVIESKKKIIVYQCNGLIN